MFLQSPTNIFTPIQSTPSPFKPPPTDGGIQICKRRMSPLERCLSYRVRFVKGDCIIHSLTRMVHHLMPQRKNP